MAAVLVGYERRPGSGGVRKGQGFELILSETWHFMVRAEEKDVSRFEVLTTPGLPVVGLLYGPLGLVCTSITADRNTTNAYYWDLVAEFETGTEEQKQSAGAPDSPDPTTWIPIWKQDSFVTVERIVVEDNSSTPKKATNSAGAPFDQPLTDSRSLPVYSFVQFEDASTTEKQICDRNNTVNATNFKGFLARSLLLNVVSNEIGLYSGFLARRVGYQVTYDERLWDEERLDVGPYYLDGGGNKVTFTDSNDLPIIGNLNGSGGAAAGDPADRTFRVKKEIEFSSFLRTA